MPRTLMGRLGSAPTTPTGPSTGGRAHCRGRGRQSRDQRTCGNLATRRCACRGAAPGAPARMAGVEEQWFPVTSAFRATLRGQISVEPGDAVTRVGETTGIHARSRRARPPPARSKPSVWPEANPMRVRAARHAVDPGGGSVWAAAGPPARGSGHACRVFVGIEPAVGGVSLLPQHRCAAGAHAFPAQGVARKRAAR